MSALRRTTRRLVVLVLGTLGLVVLTCGPALAHNTLVRSSPADGAALSQLPIALTMTFEEKVASPDLTVKYRGRTLMTSAVPGDDRSMQVDLSSIHSSGAIALTWTVVDEEDGHETAGALNFTVGAASSTASTTAPAAVSGHGPNTSALDHWSVLAHVVGYLATALFLGGLLFLALLWPAGAEDRRTRVMVASAVAAGMTSAFGALVIDIQRLPGSTRSEVLLSDYARPSAAVLLFWMLASVLVAWLLRDGRQAVRSLSWRVGTLAIGVGLIRSNGMTAHSTHVSSAWLGITADFLHMVGVSAWIGGLAVLTVGLLPRRDLGEIESVVPGYSKLAMVSVLSIVASGLVMLWQVANPIQGFWSTHYAHVLVVKLGVFAVVLLAAMVSKRWVDRSLDLAVTEGRTGAIRSFATSVGAEAFLAVGVLLAASVLVTSSPGV